MDISKKRIRFSRENNLSWINGLNVAFFTAVSKPFRGPNQRGRSIWIVINI